MTCAAVGRLGEALVDLEERHDLLHLPEVVGRSAALHLPVHRLLEEDRAEDAVAVEARAGHDPGPHRVHQVEHLRLVGEGAPVDAVPLERLRGAAAALVQRGDEPGADSILSNCCSSMGASSWS